MPELTEVEHIRRLCHENLVGKTISAVQAKEDPIVFCDVEAEAVEKALMGKTIVGTKRWGKNYILYKGPHIVGHLGMTGWVYIETKHKNAVSDDEKEMACSCRLCDGGKGPSRFWPPKFKKLQLEFDTDDAHITFVYDDVRRLGRIRLVEGDPMKSLPLSKLGFDPLQNMPDIPTFTEMVKKRAVPIKALLLDQAFSAGVGNWVADEVLWNAKIHPAHYTNELSDEECERLHENILYVCRAAADADADWEKFPKHWLFMHRWSKGKGEVILPDGNKLSYETVGGRTSAFVAEVQKLPKKSRAITAKSKSKANIKAAKVEVVDEGETSVKHRKLTAVKSESSSVTLNKAENSKKEKKVQAVPKESKKGKLVNVKEELEVDSQKKKNSKRTTSTVTKEQSVKGKQKRTTKQDAIITSVTTDLPATNSRRSKRLLV
ncbi:hypothetical protein INT43_002800 [Umbelopsis isabellina]|uniref:Formamidopyrimidine-DNA glycosylase catalytic domain-containing protein n=1 Tax=Mortierella isabellina TaxID=91625 RepID=A0A8H7Q5J1_MORIS|nr:hypothetical protein INT43_002800 [Umbelopsis isabellina]